MKLLDIQNMLDPSRRRQKRNLQIASGLGVGAAIGAIVGTLFAPYSGRLTRAKLKYKTKRGWQQS